MKLALTILILFALAACADPGAVYVGFLDSQDREIFRSALRIEDIPEANEEALVEPWTWIVVYGAPLDSNGVTVPVILGHNAIIVRRHQATVNPDCAADQLRIVTYRHELGHTQGKLHVSDPQRVMHDPAPCYPAD